MEFGEIMNKINKEPGSIDELTETKKYMNDLGMELEKHKKNIDDAMGIYQICEEF